MYIFPLILYHLSILPLPKDHQVVLKWSLFKFLWKGQNLMVHRQVCCQHPWNGDLGIPDFESHWLIERLAYLGRSLLRDTVWGQKVRDIFPRLKSNPKAKGCCKPRDEASFICKCRITLHNLPGSSDLSPHQKELYRDLKVGSASDPLVERLSWLLGEIHSQ